MGDEKVPPRTIKVVDRRRFTTEGDPRGDVPDEVKPESDVAPAPPVETVQVENAPTDASRHEPPDSSVTPEVPPPAKQPSAATTSSDFVELLVMLAQQAEVFLVGAEEFPADPDQARRMIDYLSALETKTTGNLSHDEELILSNALYQLRTLFVQSR